MRRIITSLSLLIALGAMPGKGQWYSSASLQEAPPSGSC